MSGNFYRLLTAAGVILAIAPRVSGELQSTCAYTSEFGVLNVIESNTQSLTASVAAGTCSGDGPVAISPDGSIALVGGYRSVSVVSTASNRVTRRISIPEGLVEHITFSADGSRAYLSANDRAFSLINRRTVVIVSVESGDRLGTIDQASDATPSQDGERLYVFNQNLYSLPRIGGVQIFDQATAELIAALPEVSGDGLRRLILSPDDRFLYATSHSTITVVDTVTRETSEPTVVRSGITDIAISKDGTRAYIASSALSFRSLQVVALPSTEVIDSIPLAADPRRVALSPDESFAYVSVYEQDESLATYSRTKIVDLTSKSVVATIEAGGDLTVASVPQPCTAPGCDGDCDANGSVTVDEILTALSITLSPLGSLCSCRAFSGVYDGGLTVDVVLRAVNNSLTGCPVR